MFKRSKRVCRVDTPTILFSTHHPSSPFYRIPLLTFLYEFLIPLQKSSLENINNKVILNAIKIYKKKYYLKTNISYKELKSRASFDSELSYILYLSDLVTMLKRDELLDFIAKSISFVIDEYIVVENSIRVLNGGPTIDITVIDEAINYIIKLLNTTGTLYNLDKDYSESYLESYYGYNLEIVDDFSLSEKYFSSVGVKNSVISTLMDTNDINFINLNQRNFKYYKYLLNLVFSNTNITLSGEVRAFYLKLIALIDYSNQNKVKFFSPSIIVKFFSDIKELNKYFILPSGPGNDIALILNRILQLEGNLINLSDYLNNFLTILNNEINKNPFSQEDENVNLVSPVSLLYNVLKHERSATTFENVTLSKSFFNGLTIFYDTVNILLDKGIEPNIVALVILKIKENIDSDNFFAPIDSSIVESITRDECKELNSSPLVDVTIFLTATLSSIVVMYPSSKEYLSNELHKMANLIHQDSTFRISF